MSCGNPYGRCHCGRIGFCAQHGYSAEQEALNDFSPLPPSIEHETTSQRPPNEASDLSKSTASKKRRAEDAHGPLRALSAALAHLQVKDITDVDLNQLRNELSRLRFKFDGIDTARLFIYLHNTGNGDINNGRGYLMSLLLGVATELSSLSTQQGDRAKWDLGLLGLEAMGAAILKKLQAGGEIRGTMQGYATPPDLIDDDW